jgi:hypothetical protein
LIENQVPADKGSVEVSDGFETVARSTRTKNRLSFGNADFHHLDGNRWYVVINERATTGKGEIGSSNLPRRTIPPN